MTFIDDLTADEKDLLISLPYRVGMWMSDCDDAGGDDSDEQEKRVLEGIIDGYARDVFGSEVTQHVMRETLINKAKWDEWGQHSYDRIPGDCQQALHIVERNGESNDASAFAKHLIEIAEAVAMAFSEYQYTSVIDKIKMQWTYRQEAAKAAKKGERYKSLHEFLSISPAERKVLLELADALDVEYS